MARLFLILLLAIPLCHAGLWLLNNPGTVSFIWLGYEIRTSITVLVFTLLGVFFLVALIFNILTALLLAPRRMRLSHQIKRKDKGIIALSDAFTALAIGDNSQAKQAIGRAEHLLDNAPVTQLIAAQLARNEGKPAQALTHYENLKTHKSTEFFALQGLAEYALAQNDHANALLHVEQAYILKPNHQSTAILLFSLYMRFERFDDAQQLIHKAQKKKAFTREQANHYRAMVYGMWGQYKHDSDNVQALHYYKQAIKYEVAFMPAYIGVASILSEDSKAGAALTRNAHKAWEIAPHPVIAEIYSHYMQEASPAKYFKAIQKLTDRNPQHVESLIVNAKAAIFVGEWDVARNSIKSVLSHTETPRICLLMAEIEKTENNDEKESARWLQRAVSAPQDTSWVCDNCGHIHQYWQIHCSQCDAFDSIVWRQPQNALLLPDA